MIVLGGPARSRDSRCSESKALHSGPSSMIMSSRTRPQSSHTISARQYSRTRWSPRHSGHWVVISTSRTLSVLPRQKNRILTKQELFNPSSQRRADFLRPGSDVLCRVNAASCDGSAASPASSASRPELDEFAVPEHPPAPRERREDLRAYDADLLGPRLVERVVRHARAGVPMRNHAVTIDQQERVRLDLPRKFHVDGGLRLGDRLLEFRDRPLLGSERFHEAVVDELGVDLSVSDAEILDLAVVGEEQDPAVDLAAERMRVALLDRVLLRRVSQMGHENERGTTHSGQPPYRVFVLRVLGRLRGTASIELSFLADASDSPAVGVARFWIRLGASEIPEVPSGIGEGAERHERVDRSGLLAHDCEHPAHVSPTCIQASGAARSSPPGLSRSRGLWSAPRRRPRGRPGPVA